MSQNSILNNLPNKKRLIELMKQGFCPTSKKLGEYASVGKENITDSAEREAFAIHLRYCSACQGGYEHLRQVFQQIRESFPQPEGITDADRWHKFLEVLNEPYKPYHIPELPLAHPNEADIAFVNRLEKRFEGIDDPISKLFINIGLYHSVRADDLALSKFKKEIEGYWQAKLSESRDVMNRDLRLHYLIGETYCGAGKSEEGMDWFLRAWELYVGCPDNEILKDYVNGELGETHRLVSNHLNTCLKCNEYVNHPTKSALVRWVEGLAEKVKSIGGHLEEVRCDSCLAFVQHLVKVKPWMCSKVEVYRRAERFAFASDELALFLLEVHSENKNVRAMLRETSEHDFELLIETKDDFLKAARMEFIIVGEHSELADIVQLKKGFVAYPLGKRAEVKKEVGDVFDLKVYPAQE
ncbi:hypothetical protein HYR99_27265 [Candidatus Poribacteria bacterium]|nr:hypothetical protein [Candidatus Poribacteria bacterium]